ncbi:hypothetical protein Droror1_Dr00009850 [Drosera rotundifolia]
MASSVRNISVSCFISLLWIVTFIMHLLFSEGRRIPSNERPGLVKPPEGTIKTIEADDGEVVDCVDINKQPAFQHPLLKHHQIQMEPSRYPKGITRTKASVPDIIQRWRVKGECPTGTIPIRRSIITKSPIVKQLNFSLSASISPHQYSVIHYFAPTPGEIQGAHGTIDVWKPVVDKLTDFSLTQIWVIAGDDSNTNTMEAGWQVYPARTGDNQTRLFIYWTADNYDNTGCYDLTCPGFVQCTNQIAIGAPLNVSTIDGKQVEMELLIEKDNKTGNWWLYIHNTTVGYWPSSIFTSLTNGADRIDWGGELYSSSKKKATQMGSGRFANTGYGNASYVRELWYTDSSGAQVFPSQFSPTITMPSCYNMVLNNTASGYIYYGGPGCT